MDICHAEGRTLTIESQVPQSLRCFLPTGHDGPHKAVLLDSDDNAITERW